MTSCNKQNQHQYEYQYQHQYQQQQLQYEQYILGLQEPLYKLVKDETDLRLKHLIVVVNDAIRCLRGIISVDEYKHNINRRIYDNFLFMASDAIKTKCEKGINFSRFKKEINEKTIWNTVKGYWFRNVPSLITKYLWVPLLKDIYMFYESVAINYYRNNTNYTTNILDRSKLNGVQIKQYLHKKFLKGLLEAKCQFNENSNPSGQLIQTSCWKIQSFQECINTHFDDNNNYIFNQWMNTKKKDNTAKTMSVAQIVLKCIKVHAQLEYKIFCKSIGINEESAQSQCQSNNKNESFPLQLKTSNSSTYEYKSTVPVSQSQTISVPLPQFPQLKIYDNNMNNNTRQFQNEANFRNSLRVHYTKQQQIRYNQKMIRRDSLEKHTETMRNSTNITNNNSHVSNTYTNNNNWYVSNGNNNNSYVSNTNNNNYYADNNCCPQCCHCTMNQ